MDLHGTTCFSGPSGVNYLLSYSRESQQPVSCKHTEAWGIAQKLDTGNEAGKEPQQPQMSVMFCMDAQFRSKGEWGQGNICPFCSEFLSAPAFKWPQTSFHLSQKMLFL